MKALSIRQPWAYAIVSLGKRVVNRDWAGCAYRGPVLLHAGKSRHLGEFDDAVEDILSIAYRMNAIGPDKTEEQFVAGFAVLGQERRGEPLWRPAPTLALGGIVGRAQIVDVLHPGGVPASRCAAKDPAETGDSPWYAGGFALVLDDVETLPFIPWRGSLGFFGVPDEIVQKARPHVIELRSGNFVQGADSEHGGPKSTAQRFASAAEANAFLDQHPGLLFAGGMAVPC